MKYTLKLIDGTTRHFSSFAEAVWHLNEGPQACDYKSRPATDYELWFGDQEWYMVLARNRYLVPTLDGAGSGIELITRLFDEVVHYAFAADGSIKRPHQMPGQHWQWISLVGSIAYGVYPGCIPQARWTDLSDHVRKLFHDRLGYGHNGPDLGPGPGTNSRHEVHVAYALARGEIVPGEVLDEYRSGKFTMDLRWMPALIEFPVLRGAFVSVEVLQSALLQLRAADLPMTHDLALRTIEACRGLKPDATYTQVDDALFQAGVPMLDKPGKLSSPQPPALPMPCPVSDKARRLSEQLRLCRQKVDLAHLRKEREEGRISMREFILREAAITSAQPPVEWANNVISAIESRNIETVIDVVSNADNTTTMGFLEKEYGVRLLKRPKRDRCVEACRLVGLQSQEEAEAAIDELQRQRQLRISRREAQYLAQEVEAKPVVFEGEKSNWKQVIDKLIESGHTSLEADHKGAMKRYFLMHPSKRSGVRLSVKDKTVAYARCALEARQEKAHA